MIRVLSHEAASEVKEKGRDNDLMDRIKRAEYFQPIREQIESLVKAEIFVGRAPNQVLQFVQQEVEPALLKYQQSIHLKAEVHI